MTRNSRNSLGGFSIIESLVVMLIIVLLASIVIPGWLGRSAEEATRPQRPVIPVEVPAAEKFIDAPDDAEAALGVEREESVERVIGE